MSSSLQVESVDEKLIPAEIAVCTACGRPIDLSRRHVTLNLSVEREDELGNVRYSAVRVLGRWHPAHATWDPKPEDWRRAR